MSVLWTNGADDLDPIFDPEERTHDQTEPRPGSIRQHMRATELLTDFSRAHLTLFQSAMMADDAAAQILLRAMVHVTDTFAKELIDELGGWS